MPIGGVARINEEDLQNSMTLTGGDKELRIDTWILQIAVKQYLPQAFGVLKTIKFIHVTTFLKI